MDTTSDILQFLGRLHTVVLHLPIGILVMAIILEVATRFSSYKKLKPVIPFVLFWGMITAIVTSIFGYLLSQEGGYDAEAIWNHKYLGIATAIVSTGLYLFRKNRNLYLFLLTGLAILLGLTGHSGGSITHGSSFLFEPFQEKVTEDVYVGNIDDVKVYTQVIQPIFKSKCNSCHNSGKTKGGLLLTDTIAIKKGGDSGPLFIPQQVNKSLLLERIHLPLEVEEHMPPKGKRQLSDQEMKLLQWWIAGKAEFTKTVHEYPSDPEVESILKNRFIRKKSSLEAINIKPVTKKKITTLQYKGLKVFPLGNENPWLEARLSDRKNLNQADLKNIKSVSENITILDLGNTPLDNKLIQNINSFPNLSKLFLDQTKITDEGIKKIKPLKHLKYLNLYACDVSDKSIAHLKQFKNLESLYIWQTKISDNGISDLKKTFPNIKIINGKEQIKTFATAKLKPPVIKSDGPLFTDKNAITLDLKFPWAQIYYTTDGSKPDSTSILYKDSILISNSTTIKAIAFAEEWEESNIVEETFISIKKQISSIKINQAPSPDYKAQGEKSLIDLELGSTNFKDGKWLGWQGKSLTAILSLEQPTEISRIFVSCLDNNSSWVFFPKSIKIWVSEDGKKYTEIHNKKLPYPSEEKPASLQKIRADFKKTQALYLKIQIENLGKNPNWHPAPGKPSWLFIDEIIIE